MVNTVDTGSAGQPLLQNARIEVDTVFDVLAHSHRRVIVSSLLDLESGTFEDELIDTVLQSTSPTTDRAKAHSRIAVEVSHAHLPKLADAGLIEWDRDQRFVEPTASLAALESLLDLPGSP